MDRFTSREGIYYTRQFDHPAGAHKMATFYYVVASHRVVEENMKKSAAVELVKQLIRNSK